MAIARVVDPPSAAIDPGPHSGRCTGERDSLNAHQCWGVAKRLRHRFLVPASLVRIQAPQPPSLRRNGLSRYPSPEPHVSGRFRETERDPETVSLWQIPVFCRVCLSRPISGSRIDLRRHDLFGPNRANPEYGNWVLEMEMAMWSILDVIDVQTNPSCRRCVAQSNDSWDVLLSRLLAVSCGGCVPSRMASVMSGARKARRTTRAT